MFQRTTPSLASRWNVHWIVLFYYYYFFNRCYALLHAVFNPVTEPNVCPKGVCKYYQEVEPNRNRKAVTCELLTHTVVNPCLKPRPKRDRFKVTAVVGFAFVGDQIRTTAQTWVLRFTRNRRFFCQPRWIKQIACNQSQNALYENIHSRNAKSFSLRMLSFDIRAAWYYSNGRT